MNSKLKKLPVLLTDQDAERFFGEADLSEYDLSGFKRTKFELIKKDARVNMRLPQPLLAKIKSRAAAEGIPYQRYMRDLLERSLVPGPASTRIFVRKFDQGQRNRPRTV